MMMSPQTTVEAFYAALAAGDAAGAVGLIAADVEWTEAEGFPYFSGMWRSPQEVMDKLLVPLSRDWNSFSAAPREFVDSGGRIIVFGTYTGVAKATGRKMRAPFVHVWRASAGKLKSFSMITDTLLVDRALH